jgi:Autoinducer binding domain
VVCPLKSGPPRCPGSDRIADGILEASSFSELALLLERLAAVLAVDHCTLHVISEAATTNFSTKVITTYPDAWVSRYVNRRYATLDPVSRACVTAEHGFFWDSLDQSAPAVRIFWRESVDHGIGPSGYTLPLVTERGDKLAISMASRMPTEGFRERIHRLEGDIFSLGIFLADAFCRLASEDRPASFNPTDDQLAVLRAIAMGADEGDLRSRNYQYGSYVTLERSICALFRTRTVAQAAVLAARIGLLADAPLARTDILAASSKAEDVPAAPQVGTLPRRRLARMRSPAAPEAPAQPAKNAQAEQMAVSSDSDTRTRKRLH